MGKDDRVTLALQTLDFAEQVEASQTGRLNGHLCP
jgi:hypothetical protein